MTERRLPPALEGARFLVTPDKSRFVYEQDLLGFFRGTKETRTPDLVERVRMAANQTASRRTGTYVLRPSDVFDALRAELEGEDRSDSDPFAFDTEGTE